MINNKIPELGVGSLYQEKFEKLESNKLKKLRIVSKDSNNYIEERIQWNNE